MTTTDATFRKEIRYDRVTKDYAYYLDGELKGFASNPFEAEVALDNLVYDLLESGACATAAQLDGGSDADAMAAEVAGMVQEALPAGWMRMPEGDILDADGMRVR